MSARSLATRLFRRARPRDALAPLYAAAVEHGRDPQWYLRGGVADSQDGRFDMIVAVLSQVLLRLERDGETHASESALLAELFVDDMDGQLREIGIGDVVVGKHVGKMMGALGGRKEAYRNAFGEGGAIREALIRNLYRGEAPDEEALAYTADRLGAFARDLDAAPVEDLLAGKLPPLAS